MKEILILFYDDYEEPSQILSYSLLNELGEATTLNVIDRKNSPYWRLPIGDLDEVLSRDLYIFDKKTFYKYTGDRYRNLKDVNSSIHHNGGDTMGFNMSECKHINYCVDRLRQEVNFEYLTPICDKYNDLLKAEAILDGRVMFDTGVVTKTYDHYTAGLRLRDTTGKTLSLKKSVRNSLRTKGIRIELDMESFHLRILDKLIKGGIPNDVRAHDYIVQQAELDGEDEKKQIFTAMYSENFDSINCEFFRLLGIKHKRIKSPFGREHNNFNYKVQEYESYLMSRYIQKINVDYVDILLYLYDGLYIDLKEPNKLNEYIEVLQSGIPLPFTITIGNKTKRFYNV